MPVQLGEKFRPDLGREIKEKLEDFCTAYHDANPTEVVRKAVDEFIPRDLLKNEGARAIYETLRASRKGAR